MSETNVVEAPPPASQEGSGGENKGSSNLDARSFANLLVKREAAKAAAAPKAEDSTPSKEEATPTAEKVEQTQTEAKPEETEETTEVTTEEAGEVLSNELKLDPKTQEKLNRRIGKEVGKTKRALQAAAKAEGEVAQLKAQLEAMKGGEQSQPAQAKPQVLSDIEDSAALDKYEREAKQAVRWVDEMLDMDEFPAEGIKTADGVLSKADLKKIRMNARVALEDHIPERKAFLNQREESRKQAFDLFPYLKDPESPEYAEAQEARKANPWLANVPNSEYVIGIQLLGLKKLKEMQEGGKPKPKAVQKTPMNGQSHVSSDASPGRVAGGDNSQAISALKQTLVKKGGASERDYAAYLKQREILKFS